jgi:hypothetical protein
MESQKNVRDKLLKGGVDRPRLGVSGDYVVRFRGWEAVLLGSSRHTGSVFLPSRGIRLWKMEGL